MMYRLHIKTSGNAWMRKTLDIEDDVLVAVKEIARREHLTAGQVISRPARLALTARVDQQPSAQPVAGFRRLPARGVLVSNDQVNALREHEGV